MVMIIILTGNRETAECKELEKGPKLLATYQEAVGGNIETFGTGKGWSCFVNEERVVKKLPHNPSAARLMNELSGFVGEVHGVAIFVFKDKESDAFKKAKVCFDIYKLMEEFKPEPIYRYGNVKASINHAYVDVSYRRQEDKFWEKK
jgi:hypothetical protein